jgi:hypothetical protein
MWAIISHMDQAQVGSCAIGGVVGMIAVSMFAVIIQRIERVHPTNALKAFRRLIYLVLGAGLADYVVFDAILNKGAIFFYLDGLPMMFLPLSIVVFVLWTRRWSL